MSCKKTLNKPLKVQPRCGLDLRSGARFGVNATLPQKVRLHFGPLAGRYVSLRKLTRFKGYGVFRIISMVGIFYFIRSDCVFHYLWEGK